jgi:hypothetical protein
VAFVRAQGFPAIAFDTAYNALSAPDSQ